MLPEAITQSIESLAGDLVMIEPDDPPATWQAFHRDVVGLVAALGEAGALAAQDAAARMAELALSLAEGKARDVEAVAGQVDALFQALQTGCGGGQFDEAALKDAVARAGLFLRDIEEAAIDAGSAPEIEEEFLLEIQNRIDGLESTLLSLSPPVRDEEVVRGIFREFHTLKGESGILGLTTLNEFYHNVESQIEDARSGELVLNRDAIDLLAELTTISRALLYSQVSESTAPDYIAGLIRLLAAATHGGDAGAPSVPTTSVAETGDDVLSSDVAVDEIPVDEEQIQSVTLDVRQLDHLLELVSEITLAGGHMSRIPAVQDVPELNAPVQELARACRSLQGLAGNLRMAPIRPLFNRVRRAALDAARSRTKRIDFHLSGGETKVDRAILDHLMAALIHLARNAVDHGVESAADRLAAGKPERGQVRLSARRLDADVEIELSDDGHGLDPERIRTKAIERGLIEAGARLSEQQVLDLVFASGFSTSETVSNISGRGVGMSVVRESVDALRGTVQVESTPGAGTIWRLRVPVELAAIEGLLVRLGDAVLVLPVSSVRESFRVRPDQVGTVEGQGTIVSIRGVVIPVLFLADELGLASETESVPDGVIVMIEDGDSLCGVLVDEVLETSQIIVRPLEGDLARLPLVTGAALLPDRRVALVLESRRLLDKVSVTAGHRLAAAGAQQVSSERGVETVSIGTNQVSMIDFSVRGRDARGTEHEHLFAINAFKVREFVPSGKLTPIPHAPKGFMGMYMLRDRSIPVISLSRILDLVDDTAPPEWEKIITICEFSGVLTGFLAESINRVSYISWNDILPPPDTGDQIRLDYVVGTILLEHLREDGENLIKRERQGDDAIVFVLDFERIVQQVLELYGDVELAGVQRRKECSRVLLLEDSTLIRQQMKKALEGAGLEVIEAEDGEAGLAIIREMHHRAQEQGCSVFEFLDLVLSDIEMPRMDGYTFTSHIKNDPLLRVLPVILHSSLTNDVMIARAREVHADGFVAKCDHQELVNQLMKYL